MQKDLARDFVGYGRNPPDPRWPGKARIAVNVVANFEEGAEISVVDGDPYSESTLTDSGGADQGMKARDLAAESMFEYGGRVGFWRLYNMFRRRNLPEGGFLYDSNSYADDLPYWVDVGGKPQLVVPHTFSHNDNRFARGWLSTAGDFFTYLKDAFDVLHREGETHPKFMTISLHNRLSGHPARSQGIERFIDYIGGIEGVWLCSRLQVARHWHEHHKPAPL